MRRRSLLSLAAALGLTTLLGSSSPVSAQDSGETASEPGLGPRPTGVIAVQQWLFNQPNQPLAFRDAVYANALISGVHFRANWASVEPSEGQFKWQLIDDMFAAASASGKFVALSFVPGFATPAWALPGVATATFDWQYGPKGEAGQPGSLPMPWDQTYLSRWFAFLQQVADRYGNNPQFRMIALAGPTSVSEETSLPNNARDPGLPNSGSDISQWISLGYTPAQYEAAWQAVFQQYAQVFPNQYLSLTTARTLPIANNGTRDTSQELSTLQSVINQGLSYADRFVLQDNG